MYLLCKKALGVRVCSCSSYRSMHMNSTSSKQQIIFRDQCFTVCNICSFNSKVFWDKLHACALWNGLPQSPSNTCTSICIKGNIFLLDIYEKKRISCQPYHSLYQDNIFITKNYKIDSLRYLGYAVKGSGIINQFNNCNTFKSLP